MHAVESLKCCHCYLLCDPALCAVCTVWRARAFPALQAISTAAEQESPVKPSSVVAAGYDMDSLAADDLEYNYDKAGLAALRRRLAAAIHDFKGAHAQYEEVIRQVRR